MIGMARSVSRHDLCKQRWIHRCFVWIGVACLVLVILSSLVLRRFGLILNWQLVGDLVNNSRNTHVTCNVDPHNVSSLLGPTRQDDLNKIRSYKFHGIQPYIDELFLPDNRRTPSASDVPVFLSAMSSNHLLEGYLMLKNFTETVIRTNKDAKLILFDIGLTRSEVQQLSETCTCEIRRFPFNKYPVHVRNLGNFAWKSLIIQAVASEYPFLIWMDTSTRFTTGKLTNLFTKIKQQGLLMNDMGTPRLTATITERTHQNTFNHLQENPCAFANQAEKSGGLVLLHANAFITEYFLKPLVSCALAYGCMDPGGISPWLINCSGAPDVPFTFQWCHRFDQSVMGILFARLFHGDLKSNTIDTVYFNFCRGESGKECDR